MVVAGRIAGVWPVFVGQQNPTTATPTTARQNPVSATTTRQNTYELEKQNAERVAASSEQIRLVLIKGIPPSGGIEESGGERGDRQRAAGR